MMEAVLKLRPRQGEVFLDDHRFLVLVAGRRWAKTTTLLMKLIFKKACQQRGLYGYFAPTYKQAKLIAWNILKMLIPPHYRLKINESELSILLANGSVIRLFGLDKAEHLLGIKLHGALIDEYDQTKKDVYEMVIRPALADTQGFCWFIGSPDATKRKLRALYDEVRINKRPDWQTFHFKSIEGGYIPKEELENAKAELDPRTYREQFEASFEDVYGQVYYGFHPEHNVHPRAIYSPHLPLRVFFDFNVNPFCVGFAHFIEYKQEDRLKPKPDDIHVVDELIVRNSNTPQMCGFILERYGHHKAGFIVYGDAAGKSRHTSSSLSDYQIIIDRFKNIPGFQLRVKDANPHVKDRVNAVNSKLLAYDGSRHVFLNPQKTKTLQKDFMNVIYKEGTTDIDKEDLERTHISDAFGYMCEYEYPVIRGYVS